MEIGQNFQAAEAQKGRDFQGGQFDQSFALDQEMKRAQMGLAGREMDMRQQEQQFNMGGNLADRGYGVDLTQLAPTDFRDAHTGRLINPNGRGLRYEEVGGVYAPGNIETQAPEQAAMERRLGEMNAQKEQTQAEQRAAEMVERRRRAREGGGGWSGGF